MKIRMLIRSLLILVILAGCIQVRENSKVLYGQALSRKLRTFVPHKVDSLSGQQIVMIIAPRAFRDEEFQIPYEYLTNLGYKIKVAGCDTIIATGMLGLALKPQLVISDIRKEDYVGIILVGGTGSAIYWSDSLVHSLVRHYVSSPKTFVAAICLAPITLARAGVLKDKVATVYADNFTLNEFKRLGVKYLKTDCVLVENIITASGPQSALKFAQTIAYFLQTSK
jgi:protease I